MRDIQFHKIEVYNNEGPTLLKLHNRTQFVKYWIFMKKYFTYKEKCVISSYNTCLNSCSSLYFNSSLLFNALFKEVENLPCGISKELGQSFVVIVDLITVQSSVNDIVIDDAPSEAASTALLSVACTASTSLLLGICAGTTALLSDTCAASTALSSIQFSELENDIRKRISLL